MLPLASSATPHIFHRPKTLAKCHIAASPLYLNVARALLDRVGEHLLGFLEELLCHLPRSICHLLASLLDEASQMKFTEIMIDIERRSLLESGSF
jgi:hypothetical protein